MDRRVLQVVRKFSRKLIDQGAEGVVLFGSWVRGDAHKESDIDIHAIGRGSRCELERFQGFLISVSWATVRSHHVAFKNPSKVGGTIPAWRGAKIIYDPKGIAEALKRKAREWRWELLGTRTDKWVAEELTGWAEEVHKLVGSLELGQRESAAVQRSLLAIHLARILAVYHRILYDSENQLWGLVSVKMGPEWTKVQSTALGEGEETFVDTCNAALQLFALVAHDVMRVLDERQYEVVAHACKMAGHPLKDDLERTR
jgi:predicted nucleotidyltransferase